MTKQEIINACIIEQKILEDDLSEDNEELEFFRKFFKYDYSTSIERILEVPYTDFTIAAILGLCGKDITFEEISEKVNSFSSLIENTTSTDLYILVMLIDKIHQDKCINQVIEYFEDPNKKRGMKSLKDFFTGKSKYIVEPFKELLEANNCIDSNISNLLRLYELNPTYVNKVLAVVQQLKGIAEEHASILDSINEIQHQTGYKVTKGSKNNAIKTIIEYGYDIEEVKKILSHIYDSYSQYELSRKENDKNNKKVIGIYDKFLKEFSKMFNTDEIKNYADVIKRLPDQEMRESVLRLVYEHNKTKYEEIDMYHKELSKNSKVHYLALLKDYNISKDDVNINNIMKNSYDDFSEMLKVLFLITKDKKTIISALEISDLETVKYIKELKDRGILIEEAIKKYNMVFNSDSDLFNTLNENIKTISKYGLNPINFSNIYDILLNTSLDDNLKVLTDYDLVKTMKNSVDYRYLGKINLNVLIDKIIELGFEEKLINNLDLLNEDNWDRIYVLKGMGYEIEDDEELLSFLRSDSFIVADKELNNYIPNIVPYYEFKSDKSDISSLDEYKDTARSYKINGVIASSNRVLRNFNEDSDTSLLKALVNNGIYSREEVEKINEEINGKVLEKQQV